MNVCLYSIYDPQIIHFNRVFHYTPSILGYPYFGKHPYINCMPLWISENQFWTFSVLSFEGQLAAKQTEPRSRVLMGFDLTIDLTPLSCSRNMWMRLNKHKHPKQSFVHVFPQSLAFRTFSKFTSVIYQSCWFSRPFFQSKLPNHQLTHQKSNMDTKKLPCLKGVIYLFQTIILGIHVIFGSVTFFVSSTSAWYCNFLSFFLFSFDSKIRGPFRPNKCVGCFFPKSSRIRFYIPSRERIHIRSISPPWEEENHLQKCLGIGYVSSQDGRWFWEFPHALKPL